MTLQGNTSDSSATIIFLANESSSVKSLFESADIDILPQHRLKVRQTNLIPSVCFYNGSFVPIHAGHINVLQEAKKYINNLGTHELIAAYISPSHSGYIAQKLEPEEVIGVGHRLSMINLAIETLDWVMVDLFELFQPCNTWLTIIMKHFISRVHSQLPDGTRIDVFWLQGEDALSSIGSSDGLIQLGFHPIYIVNRGFNENILTNELKSIQNYHEKRWKDARGSSAFSKHFHIIYATHMNLSSSNIRACASNPSVTHEQLQLSIQFDSITTYILQHQLWSTLTDALPTAIPVLFEFPNEITDVTDKVLSHMLSEYSNAPVKIISFEVKKIGIGKGWGGALYRFGNIQYSPDCPDYLPQSIILKVSNGTWNQLVASVEPEFYIKLKPRISNINIPKCYYAARHPYSSIKSLLLLEDLSINYDPLSPVDSLEDSTLFSIIASIASLHAEFFKHPLLKQKTFAWLPSLNSTVTHYHNEYALRMADNEYTQLLKSNVSDEAYTYAKALLSHVPHLFQRLSDENFTLSHGDFWINNIFVQRNELHKMVLFDWQTCCRANGLIDVVFLLRLLGNDRARLLEPYILELYHQVLVKYGVLQYEASEICEDYYSLALPFMFVMCSTWKHLKRDRSIKIMMILEDIVIHSKKPNN